MLPVSSEIRSPGMQRPAPGWLDSGAGDGPDLWPGIMGEAGRKQWLGVGRCSSLGRGISGHCPAAGGGRQEQRFHAGGTRVSSSSFLPPSHPLLSHSLFLYDMPPYPLPPALPPRRPSRVSTPSHPPGAQRGSRWPVREGDAEGLSRNSERPATAAHCAGCSRYLGQRAHCTSPLHVPRAVN